MCVWGSMVYLCNGCRAIVHTGWCYRSRYETGMCCNCEIKFISIAHACLYPKAIYCALSSTFHPDLCIYCGINDVDMTGTDTNIVIHVYHHMILHTAID